MINSRRLGPAISKKIYRAVMGSDPEAIMF
jgi:hypothetical protein